MTQLTAAERGLLLKAAAGLDTDLSGIALAALVALLYRHTQQSDLTLDVQHRSEGPRAYDFSVVDELTLADLVEQVRVQPGDTARHSNILYSDEPLRAPHELGLCVQDTTSGLRMHLSFDARLFGPARATEWLEQYRLLLLQLAAKSSESVLLPSLHTDAARAVLPDPRRALPQPLHAPIGAAFRAWAARAPDMVALEQTGRSFSYAELASSSQLIARAIAARVAPHDVVAVSGPRSFGLVSAMLGVLQSGAVLLTLDPALPRERRQLMIEQANARLLLAVGDAAADDLSVAPGRSCLRLAADGGGLDAPNLAPALPAIDPEQAAYVFFTSGSTGVPKAVLGSHKGLAHFLAWQRTELEITPGDRASQLTALSFDVVLRDMFLALTSGATLCLPTGADVVDPTRILTWLAQERVSVLHVVPSLARLWLSHVPAGLTFSSLRLVCFAGEPLTDVLVTRFREVFGDQVQVVNLYGPTETTLAKCFARVPTPAEPGVQSIGRPLPQTQVLILNRRQQLCGLHEVGEIAIRTPFRSLGYLDNQEASARAFVPNPFGDDARDLIYLTGDSGRYRADGQLEILGRIDNQVKIRGVRIEPGEIEAALGHHGGVREVVVVAQKDASDTKFLAAYVVPRTPTALAEPAPLIAELRSHLRALLPEVMVPAAFALLPALPLNANGKVDKKSLPEIARSVPVAPEAVASSERERALAAIWCDVLGVPEIGVNESFYDLGGDSLTAVRVLIRMRTLGLEEAVCRSLLQGRTIAQLARAAERGIDHADDDAPPASPAANMRLMLNAFRGLLILMILLNHFTPGIVRRVSFVASIQKYLWPLYNWGTPGFALAFGAALGFVYYPQYLRHPQRTRALLWRSTAIVSTGALALALGMHCMRGLSPLLPQEAPIANVLSFYALGLATAGLWLHLLSRTRYATLSALLCAGLCSLSYLLLRRLTWPLPPHSPALVILGKWGYLNMCSGVLLGFAFGAQLKGALRLSSRYWLGGGVLVGLGILGSLSQPFKAAWLTDQEAIQPWKWLFYSGLSLWTLLVLERSIMAWPMQSLRRSALNLLGVFGQLTLPVFLLAYFCWALGMLISASGQPMSVRFSVEFGSLFLLTFFIVRRTYRLFHGHGANTTTASRVRPVRSEGA